MSDAVLGTQVQPVTQEQVKQAPEVSTQTSEQKINDAWQAGFSKEYKGHEAFKSMGHINDLGKSYIEAQSKLSKAMFRPGDDASPEEKAAFWKSWGVPDTTDEYEIPTELDGLKISDDFVKWRKEEAKRLNLTKEQAKNLAEGDIKYIGKLAKAQQEVEGKTKAETEAKTKAQEEEIKARIESANKTLREEWGVNYDKNAEIAKKGLSVLAKTPEEMKELEDAGMLTKPSFIRMAHAAGLALGEGKYLSGTSANGPQRKTLVDYGVTPGVKFME